MKKTNQFLKYLCMMAVFFQLSYKLHAYFPEYPDNIAESSIDNPYAIALNEWLNAKESRDVTRFDLSGGPSRTIGRYILNRTWGLTHPLSKLEDPELIQWHKEQIIKEVDYLLNVSEEHNGRLISGGKWNVDRFVLRRLLDAFYRLQNAGLFNEEMPVWLNRTRLSVDYQYNNYWRGPKQAGLPGWNTHAGYYPNSDVMYTLLMGLAGKLYDEPKYLERAHEFVFHLEERLLPKGAFHYDASTTELSTYHSLNISCLARYYDITGDTLAKTLIKRTVEYYPLTFGPYGITERTPYTWFKRQMSYEAGYTGAEIVAWFTGDGRNKYFASESIDKNASVYAVDYWRNNIKPVKPADHFVCYDPNINGVRGRFDRFSWVGSLRHGTAVDAFAGVMIANKKPGENALNASLELVTPEIGMEESDDLLYKRAAFTTGEHFIQDLIIGDEFGALAVSYHLHKAWKEYPDFEEAVNKAYPWNVQQVWLFLENNLVGLMYMISEQEQEVIYAKTRVRVIPHNSLEKLSAAMYAANQLRIKIHGNTFSKVTIGDAVNTAQRRFSQNRLGSTIHFTENKKTYNKGETFKLALEAYPDWNESVEEYSEMNLKGLKGFKIRKGEDQYIVLFNPGSEPVNISLQNKKNAEIYRSAFVIADIQEESVISRQINPGKLILIKQ